MVFSRNAYYVVINFIQTNKKVSEIGYFYMTAINYKLSQPDVTDWNQIENILLLQHREICITVYGTVFIQEPLLQKHIKFVRRPCVVNDYNGTCVASKSPELFLKTQRILQECPMTIRF